MKTLVLCVACLSLSSAIVFSAPRDSDPAVVAISAAIPDATEIRQTSWGYKVSTASGSRNVYKTSTGYRITASPKSGSIEILRTSTGYKIRR